MDAKDYYDRVGESYLDGHRTKAMAVVGHFEVNFIRASMPSMPKPRILEIGPGPGRLAVQFVDSASHFVGFDISAEMLRACRKRVGNKAVLIQGDASDGLPFDDTSFDFIYALRSLKYTTDFDKVLSEVKRVLAPGGHFCFSIPNRLSLNSLYVKAHVNYSRTTAKEIEKKLESIGFTVKEMQGGPKLPDLMYVMKNEKFGIMAAKIDERLNGYLGPIASRELYIHCIA